MHIIQQSSVCCSSSLRTEFDMFVATLAYDHQADSNCNNQIGGSHLQREELIHMPRMHLLGLAFCTAQYD